MLILVRCTCGNSIGDLVDAFKYLRYKKVSKAVRDSGRNITTDMFAIITELKIEFGDELNQLGLMLDCCRSAMLSADEFPLWADP